MVATVKPNFKAMLPMLWAICGMTMLKKTAISASAAYSMITEAIPQLLQATMSVTTTAVSRAFRL